MNPSIFQKSRVAICATAFAIALAVPSVSRAAAVNWGAAQNITGDSNVSTAGTLVGAVNLGYNGDGSITGGGSGVTSTTVNGVLFQALGVSNGQATPATSGNFSLSASPNFLTLPNGNSGFGSSLAPFSSLTSQYQTLLNSGIFADTSITLTISGLTVGQQYQFEWWANFSGFGTGLHTATATNSVTLSDNTSGNAGGLGQYDIGTFIADSNTQLITFTPGSIVDFAQVNAFQLRAVPEPSNVLIGLALTGLVGYSILGRRRRVAASI